MNENLPSRFLVRIPMWYITKHARTNPQNMAAIRMNTNVLEALIFIEVCCFC